MTYLIVGSSYFKLEPEIKQRIKNIFESLFDISRLWNTIRYTFSIDYRNLSNPAQRCNCESASEGFNKGDRKPMDKMIFEDGLLELSRL